MSKSTDLIGIEKIEHMFANNISFLSDKQAAHKKTITSSLNIKKIFSVLSFFHKKIYRFLPNFLKDIFFWAWVSHKTPATKIFAKTRYDELRTKLDIKASSIVMKASPAEISNQVMETFRSGFFSTKIYCISELNALVDGVLDYAKPSHAGARPYFKDGNNKKIEGSFSAYYKFSDADSEKITLLLNDNVGKEFNYHLSTLAGYKCALKDISYSLGIVYGENSNSEMHQDTFSSIAKGFIYLQDMDDTNSPFQYLEGSYHDASFRSLQTNQAVLNDDLYSSGSTRVRGKVLEHAIEKYNLQTFVGSRGLFVIANTAGYHRKGEHNSMIPRITLNFEIQRKGIVSKFIRNLSSVIKFHVKKIFNLSG
jgi:hypothetical protein